MAFFKKKFSHVVEAKKGSELIQEKYNSAKAVLVHVHKCAGTSLMQYFEESPSFLCCSPRMGDYNGRSGREYFSDTLWERLFKFAIIRNPYSRIVSVYRMFMRDSKPLRNLFQINGTFEDFVSTLDWVDLENHNIRENEIGEFNLKKSIWGIWNHCCPYSNPKYMIDEMDYIGRLESLSESLQYVSNQLGDSYDFNRIERKKFFGSYDYRNFYNDYTKKTISRIYEKDLNRFGYDF